jgi:hypothetical protein
VANQPTPRRLDADTAERLSRACGDVADAGALVGPKPAHTLARLRAPGVSEREVDTVLAEVEEILRARGLLGSGSASRGESGSVYRPLPGLGGGHPIEEVHMCPGDLCARVEVARPGTAVPTCAVWGCPLPLFRADR